MKKILAAFLINIIFFCWVFAISDSQKSKIKILVNNLEKRINLKWESLRLKYIEALKRLQLKYKNNKTKVEIIKEIIKWLQVKNNLESSSWSNNTTWINDQNIIAQSCYIGQIDPSGIVYSCDKEKKIMAQEDAPKKMKFDFEADTYCKNWNFGGFVWRLPTWDEFGEIYKNLYNHTEIWSTFKSTQYWLADDYETCPSSVWNTIADLTSKSVKCGNVFTGIMWVRCVRDLNP